METETGEPIVGIATHTLQRAGTVGKRPTKSVADGIVDGLYWIQRRGRAEALRVAIGRAEDLPKRVQIARMLTRAMRETAPTVVFDWRLANEPEIALDFGQLSVWRKYLARHDATPLSTAASEIEAALPSEGFRWYSRVSAPCELSGRIRGLEVCSAVDGGGALRFAFGVGEEEDGLKASFDEIRRRNPFPLETSDAAEALSILAMLARERDGGLLGGAQGEHDLESRILAGEQPVSLPDGRNLVPVAVPTPFQFPARWAARDRRHIDLLMRVPGDCVPYVVELKAGSEGEYLRHAIGQAALYREFVRQATDLHFWFGTRGLDAGSCEAVVALPSSRDPLFREAEQLGGWFGVSLAKLAPAEASPDAQGDP